MALFQFSACGPKWCLWMSIILLLTSVRSFVYISKQVRYNKTLTSSCAGYFHIGYNSTNLRSKSTAATNPTTISRQPPYYPTLPVNWPRVINRGPIRSRDLCCVRRCQATGCWRQQLLQLRQSCHLLVQYRDVRMADESAGWRTSPPADRDPQNISDPPSDWSADLSRGVYPYLPMATNAPWSILGEWTKSLILNFNIQNCEFCAQI